MIKEITSNFRYIAGYAAASTEETKDRLIQAIMEAIKADGRVPTGPVGVYKDTLAGIIRLSVYAK